MYMFFIFTEFDVDITDDEGLYDTPLHENLNALIDAIEEDGDDDVIHILMMDELTFDRDANNLNKVNFKGKKTHVVMGINPAGSRCKRPFGVVFEKQEGVLEMRLTTRHRNALRIAVFLTHLNQYYLNRATFQNALEATTDFNNQIVDQYKCLDMSDDMPLAKSCLSDGKRKVLLESLQNRRSVNLLLKDT